MGPLLADQRRVIDPDLLDRGVVEQRLEGAESRDPREEMGDDTVDVGDGCDRAGEAVLVVGTDDVVGDAPNGGGIALGIDVVAADPGANLLVEVVEHGRVEGGLGRG